MIDQQHHRKLERLYLEAPTNLYGSSMRSSVQLGPEVGYR